jgi:hypothetical protein
MISNQQALLHKSDERTKGLANGPSASVIRHAIDYTRLASSALCDNAAALHDH